MMRTLLAILLFPLLVQAAGEGMWQASSVGITLNHRGESMSSAPLSTRQPASGLMTLVAWRYQLIGRHLQDCGFACVRNLVVSN